MTAALIGGRGLALFVCLLLCSVMLHLLFVYLSVCMLLLSYPPTRVATRSSSEVSGLQTSAQSAQQTTAAAEGSLATPPQPRHSLETASQHSPGQQRYTHTCTCMCMHVYTCMYRSEHVAQDVSVVCSLPLHSPLELSASSRQVGYLLFTSVGCCVWAGGGIPFRVMSVERN